jgi:hypothetical protein
MAPKNGPYLTYQSTGDLSNEKVLNASGPITFNSTTATIGFNSAAALTVASLSANSISLAGVGLAGVPILTSTPTAAFPGAKVLGGGSGVTVSTVGSNTTVQVDSTVARTSGATFTGLVTVPTINATSVSSTNLNSTNISSTLITTIGLTGSLTKLSSGADYLRAGSNISLSTGSDGSVTITASTVSGAPLAARYLLLDSTDAGALSQERILVAGPGLTSIDSGAGGNYTIKVSDSQVAFLTGSIFSGPVTASNLSSLGDLSVVNSVYSNRVVATSLTGSLTKLSNGDDYLRAGTNVYLSTGSDGSVTISAETGSFMAGPFLLHEPNANFPGSLAIIEGDGIQIDEDEQCGNLILSAKLGAGPGIELDILPTRQIIISSTIGDAFYSGSFVLVSASDDFPSARVITSSLGIDVNDGGAGGAIDLRVDPNVVAFLTGARFTGDVRFDGDVKFTGKVEFGDPKFYSIAYFYAGLSGSLTALSDGTPYLNAGPGIAIVTESNGSITIYNDGTVGDITAVNAGLGLTGGGLSGSVVLGVDPTLVAFLSGSNFTGPTQFSAGLTGSLTQLIDGSPYLNAGQNIELSTGSNGSITISSLTSFQNLTGSNGFTVEVNGNSATGSIDASVIPFLTGAGFTGEVQFYSGLTGSLTRLIDGSAYIRAGQNVDVSTGSDGSITVSSLTSFQNLTGTDGIIVTVSGNSATASADPNKVAFLTGAHFTGLVSFDEGLYAIGLAQFESASFSAPAIFNSGLSGSLTTLFDGTPYLNAGEGISITTASNGSITIASNMTASVSVSGRERETQWLDSTVAAGVKFDFTTLNFDVVSHDEDLIEVYLNGQLQHSASQALVESGLGDYYITGTYGVVFGFDLNPDDSIDVVVQGGDSAPASTLNEPFITFTASNNLNNSRTLTAGAGIEISTGSAGQVVVSTNGIGGNSSAFLARLAINDVPSGAIDSVNDTFTLARAPSDTSQVMIWLNGQLLTQGPGYDYTIAGSTLTFYDDSIPVEDDVLSAMYPYVEAASRYVLNERVIMTQVGPNIQGDLASTPQQSAKLMLFWNGQLLSQGVERDYVIVGKTIYINPGVLNDYLDPDDIFVATYTAVAENVYYEINEEITIYYDSTLGLWKANLTHEPTSQQRVMLFMNGQLLRAGVSEDFISAGDEIVILDDDIEGDFRFYATYQYS